MTPASDISSLLSSTGTAVTAEMAAAGATNPPLVSTLTTAGCVPVLAVLSPSLSVNQIKNIKNSCFPHSTHLEALLISTEVGSYSHLTSTA